MEEGRVAMSTRYGRSMRFIAVLHDRPSSGNMGWLRYMQYGELEGDLCSSCPVRREPARARLTLPRRTRAMRCRSRSLMELSC